METGESWFLSRHEDGSVFGPVPFDPLRRWAAAALESGQP